MSPSTFALLLRGRWRVIALITAATVLAVWIGARGSSPTYVATATLLVDSAGYDELAAVPNSFERAPGASAPKPLFFGYLRGLPGNAQAAQQRLSLQANVAYSEQVARMVVEGLGMPQQPNFMAQWEDATRGQGDFVAWMAERIQGGLAVSIPPASTVIELSYRATDPGAAAAMANVFAASVLLVNQKMRQQINAPVTRELTRQAERSRLHLQSAWRDLLIFQRTHGIQTVGDLMEPASARSLANLVPLLARSELGVITAERREREISRQPALAPGRQEVNPATDLLAEEISQQRAQLQQARQQFGASHPTVRMLQASLAERERQLDRELGLVGGEARSQLESEQAVTTWMAKRLEEEKRQGRSRLDLQREASSLFQNLMVAYADEQQVEEAAEIARMREALDASQISMLSKAYAPVYPESPNVPRLVLMAAVLGLGLGVTAAVLLNWLDARIHGVATLASAGLPVLARLGHTQDDEDEPPALMLTNRRLPS